MHIKYKFTHSNRNAALFINQYYLEKRVDGEYDLIIQIDKYKTGFGLDFFTKGSERNAYDKFVKYLTAQNRKIKIKTIHIVVSGFPVAVAATPNGWTAGRHGSYDYAALAEYADYLMIMAYDESRQGSDPGPVASATFVERSIAYAFKYAPPEKTATSLRIRRHPTTASDPIGDLAQEESDHYRYVVRERSQASTSSAIRTTLDRGDSFTVIGDIQNGWYAVKLANGTSGFVHGDYVTFRK